MNNLKEGDLIEVQYAGNWESRMLLFIDKHGNAYVFSKDREKKYIDNNFDRTDITIYCKIQWRPIPEKKYRPFTKDDNWKDYFRDRWIKNKNTQEEYKVIGIENYQIHTWVEDLCFEEVFYKLENLDGSPLGVLDDKDNN